MGNSTWTCYITLKHSNASVIAVLVNKLWSANSILALG